LDDTPDKKFLMNNSSSIQSEFIAQCIHRIDENIKRVESCFNKLTEDEVCHKPNISTNSIGNLVLHLCGNIRQYVISSLGGAPDERQRDLEFSADGSHTKSQLLEKFMNTISEAKAVMQVVSGNELLRVRTVQGFQYSGIGIIIHITEHLSYHTGQIALITKLIKNADLGFYKGIDLNIKNVK
jgi:uncharacterized damage-inducible protein DinB